MNWYTIIDKTKYADYTFLDREKYHTSEIQNETIEKYQGLFSRTNWSDVMA